MKMQKILPLFVISLIASALPQATLAQNADNGRESRMLMHLLKMDGAELQRLRETVERIEAMSPEERANMRERLGKLQKMDPERRKALCERYQSMPKEKREAMRQRWMEMSPEERSEWREKLRSMSPEERIDAMDAAGIMPPRHRGKMRAEQGPPSGDKGPSPQRRGSLPSLD
ncbi:MAG: DUF3106 domain-containing protein [Opitutales bacterium]